MIEFLWPMAALALPLPILVYLLAPRGQPSGTGPAGPLLCRRIVYEGTTGGGRARALLKRLLLIFMWSALVLAATRPQWIGEPVSLPISGRDLLLASTSPGPWHRGHEAPGCDDNPACRREGCGG